MSLRPRPGDTLEMRIPNQYEEVRARLDSWFEGAQPQDTIALTRRQVGILLDALREASAMTHEAQLTSQPKP